MSLSLPSSSGASLARRSPSPRSKSGATASLEIALAQFGANLTDEERKRLNEQKSGLNDADAAFKFTLELDELDPVRRGRVAASKLCSLLQTVQIFGQVVDTYVSSNPEIAALIWGSLKLTFMVLINFTSYFHKFTDLLHGFDHLIPHFTEYESLFPDSYGLKTSICQFHLAVVSCCTQIIGITHLPWTQKALAALTQSFESKIRPAVDDIRVTAKRVKDAVTLAKAQYDRWSQVEQEKTNKSLLQQSLKAAKNLSRLGKRHKSLASAQKWKSLLNKMSSYSYETAYKNARSKRHKGTAEWVFETQKFQKWFSDEQNAVLYFSGKIGSGKTILTANVIDYIKRKKTARTSISFFFIRFDDIDSQNPDTILRSIVRQALAHQSVNKVLLDFVEKSESSAFKHETLLDLLIPKTKLVESRFIILDGLDECSPQDQRSILNIIARLLQKAEGHKIKVLISARDSVAERINRLLSPASRLVVSRLIVGSEDTDRDLLCYAREILREKQEEDWGLRDRCLIDEILEAISSGGDGMFLWVFLTIEDICTRRSDEQIREALGNIPRNLPETFNRVLQRIKQKGNAEIVQSIFKWTVAARNPLTSDQIAEVLLIQPNQPDSKENQRMKGIQHILTWCENLVQLEEGTQTVHFSHHSIRTYLLDHTEKPDGFSLTSKHCDHHIGEICLTYLHFNDFQRALSKTSQSIQLELEAIPYGIVDQTLTTLIGNHSGEHASRFIKKPLGKTKTKSTQNQSLEGLLHYATSDNTHDYPFLPYAIQNWIHHTKDIEESSSTWDIWREMDLFAEYAPWVDPTWQPLGLTNIGYASADPNVTAKRTKFLSEQNLDSEPRGRRWLALHKVIAYAQVVENFALAAKVAAHMIDWQMPLDSLLLEDLLQARRRSVKTSPTQSQEGHNRLVDIVAELSMRDNSLFSRLTMDSSFSSLTSSHSTCHNPSEIHSGSHYLICFALRSRENGNPGDNIYASFFRLHAQLEKAGLDQQALARFQTDCKEISRLWGQPGAKDPGHWVLCERACHSAIDIGGQWSVTILHWLVTSYESKERWCLQYISSCVRHAIIKQNEEALRVLLDDKTWPTKYWYHHTRSLTDLAYSLPSSWLPNDLKDRLYELNCLMSHDEDMLYESLIRLDWHMATEMEEQGVRITSKQREDLDTRRVFYNMLSCNRQTGSGGCILNGSGGTMHICSKHRQEVEEAIEYADG